MSDDCVGVDQESSRARTEAPEGESREARVLRLRTTGFRKLRAGRIHVRCYSCGRKVSNTVRMEYDPPAAVLIETPCAKCSLGCKEPPSYYFDVNGAEVEEPEPYCADCGCYLDGGMIARSERDPSLCVECAPDATEAAAGSVVLASELSWSTPKKDSADVG